MSKGKYSDESNSIDSSSCSSESDEDEDEDLKDPEKIFNVIELCYYKKIIDFYKACSSDNIEKMINIIDGKSSISLRILDWFVTKYSKKKIDCNITNNDESFDVRISYKSQLKSFKKRYFDPFRRRQKFMYNFVSNNKSIITTLGQLNFFKWAFANNILIYVEKNLKQISKEMNISNKEEKKKKKDKEKEKEKLKILSEDKKDIKFKKNTTIKTGKLDNIKINTTKIINNDEMQIILKFD
jgi:hypothetical protein